MPSQFCLRLNDVRTSLCGREMNFLVFVEPSCWFYIVPFFSLQCVTRVQNDLLSSLLCPFPQQDSRTLHHSTGRMHTTLGSPNDSTMSYGRTIESSLLFSLVIVNAIMADSSVVLRHPLAEVSVDD